MWQPRKQKLWSKRQLKQVMQSRWCRWQQTSCHRPLCKTWTFSCHRSKRRSWHRLPAGSCICRRIESTCRCRPSWPRESSRYSGCRPYLCTCRTQLLVRMVVSCRSRLRPWCQCCTCSIGRTSSQSTRMCPYRVISCSSIPSSYHLRKRILVLVHLLYHLHDPSCHHLLVAQTTGSTQDSIPKLDNRF